MAMRDRLANRCYNNVKQVLNDLGWKYECFDDKLRVKFGVYGEDLSSNYYLTISAEKETATLAAYLPYRTPRQNTDNLARAISMANSRFYNGSFEFNAKNREICFRVTTLLLGGMELSCEAIKYMIDVACDMVDKYDDKFFAVAKGYLSLDDFYALITNK